MKTLVTGGAGFIGSTIVRRLLADGAEVRVLDNLDTGRREWVPPDVELIEGDIRSPEALARACRGVEVVIHQAALVSVVQSFAEPGRCWDVNVQGTNLLLDAALAANCRRVVMASSAAVYGDTPGLPKLESSGTLPLSPYGFSKLQNEVDAAFFSRTYGLETVCFRYFNVFGPRQRPDSPYSGVMAIVASKLLADQPFTIFGTGEQTRDFVFSEDLARAVSLAAHKPGLEHTVLNLGSGRRTPLIELPLALGELLGRKPRLRFAPARRGDIEHSQADVTGLFERLGYVPDTPLRAGLQATLAWMCEEQA